MRCAYAERDEGDTLSVGIYKNVVRITARLSRNKSEMLPICIKMLQRPERDPGISVHWSRFHQSLWHIVLEE